MQTTTEMQKEFYDRLGAPYGTSLPAHMIDEHVEEMLRESAHVLKEQAHLLKQWLKNNPTSSVLLRAQLHVEETSELLEALANQDEVAALDAVADLDYVTHGTAVVFNLPLEAAVAEVHRSNMTKEPSVDHRMVKGPNYSPPNLKKVLESYWKAQAIVHDAERIIANAGKYRRRAP